MPRLDKHITCLITLIGILSISMAVSASDSLEKRYARADSLFRSWKIDEAILTLEQISRDYPEHDSTRNLLVRAYRFKGIDLYALDRYSDAVATWRKAIKIDAKNKEINRFIGRVLMEQNLLRRYDNDFDTSADLPAESYTAKAEPSAKKEPPPPKVHIPQKQTNPAPKAAATPSFMTNHPVVTTYFQSGLVFPVGSAANGHNAGWRLGGGVNFPSGVRLLRLGIEGTYTRLSQDESIIPSLFGRFVSVAGVGINSLVTLRESPALSIEGLVGTGIYEIAIGGHSLMSATDSFDKDTKLGYTFGIRLKKTLHGFNLIGATRYFYLNSNLAPNLLQFSIGVSAGG